MKSQIASISMLCALALAAPASASILYDNGPVNGQASGGATDGAYTINYGYFVSDSFTLSSDSTVNGVSFDVWNFPGDATTAVDWSITSAINGGGVYGSGAGAATSTAVVIPTNIYGYTINLDQFSIAALNLAAGTYYLNLQNAVSTSGDPIFWDENVGPSSAYWSGFGTAVSSETFQILGDVAAPAPEPASLALLGAGLTGLGFVRRRRA